MGEDGIDARAGAVVPAGGAAGADRHQASRRTVRRVNQHVKFTAMNRDAGDEGTGGAVAIVPIARERTGAAGLSATSATKVETRTDAGDFHVGHGTNPSELGSSRQVTRFRDVCETKNHSERS